MISSMWQLICRMISQRMLGTRSEMPDGTSLEKLRHQLQTRQMMQYISGWHPEMPGPLQVICSSESEKLPLLTQMSAPTLTWILWQTSKLLGEQTTNEEPFSSKKTPSCLFKTSKAERSWRAPRSQVEMDTPLQSLLKLCLLFLCNSHLRVLPVGRCEEPLWGQLPDTLTVSLADWVEKPPQPSIHWLKVSIKSCELC